LVFELFGQQGVAVPGKEGALTVHGLGAPPAQRVVAHADGSVVGGAHGGRFCASQSIWLRATPWRR
jgi:hypothetical protein